MQDHVLFDGRVWRQSAADSPQVLARKAETKSGDPDQFASCSNYVRDFLFRYVSRFVGALSLSFC
jgi:hypothetical protein